MSATSYICCRIHSNTIRPVNKACTHLESILFSKTLYSCAFYNAPTLSLIDTPVQSSIILNIHGQHNKHNKNLPKSASGLPESFWHFLAYFNGTSCI